MVLYFRGKNPKSNSGIQCQTWFNMKHKIGTNLIMMTLCFIMISFTFGVDSHSQQMDDAKAVRVNATE